MSRLRRATPRAKRPVKRGRRHGKSGPRKRITVFLSAPLLKKVSRILAAEGRTLEACLEEALGEWLTGRQPMSSLTASLQNVTVAPEVAMKLDRITVNPDVCQGQPTIRGLRITVAFLMKQVAAGMTPADILKAYPELEAEDLRQAAEYAAWLAGEQARPLPTPEGR